MRPSQITDLINERDRLAHDLAIAEDALEAERQWRLTSLPALEAAEARAEKAGTDAAELRRYGYAPAGLALVRINTEDRPWAAPDQWRSAYAESRKNRP